MEEIDKALEVALKYKAVCDNPRVCKFKNKIIEEVFDIVNGWEYNSEKVNFDCWKGLSAYINDLNKAVNDANRDNHSRENAKLQILTAERNKLNREISTLKKANLD